MLLSYRLRSLFFALLLIECATPNEESGPSTIAPQPIAAGAGNLAVANRSVDTVETSSKSAPAPIPTAAQEPPPPALSCERSQPLSVGMLPTVGGPNAEKVREADLLLARGDAPGALTLLANVSWAPAELLKARAFLRLGQHDAALDALMRASKDNVLTALVAFERGQVALARVDPESAVDALLPLVSGEDASIATRAALPLMTALAATDPAALIATAEVIEKWLPKQDPDARSNFLEALAQAHATLGHVDQALRLRLTRFLEEPVSLVTPETPPAGSKPSPIELLTRAEKLLEANRNEKAIDSFDAILDETLSLALRCRKQFGIALAHRKLHHYGAAEEMFTKVILECSTDESLVRRAMYLNAKVISIADGLRAVPVIERFAKRFAGHSMVDDVLFWAGDLYHRRKMWTQAETYFRRIEEMAEKGDQCGDARWRLAWMSFRQGELKTAEKRMRRLLDRDNCVTLRFDRARAHYWLGRIAELQENRASAASSYESAVKAEPLGYYSQLALKRLNETAPEQAQTLIAGLSPPIVREPPPLCPGPLASTPGFIRGLELLLRGLRSDASHELSAIEMPAQKSAGKNDMATPNRCGEHDPELLLALLLDRAGVYGAAHWRLRNDFASVLSTTPTPETHAIWIAAYPLAYRELVAAAEVESQVPPLLLQALCREESALDPAAVSWAGAYGLTQLLVSSAQGAGKLVSPPVEVRSGEELLDPALSARLGGALLGSLVAHFQGNAGLALAAYNASQKNADTWWARHAGEPFDVFEEEITIKETRGYVARVLKTWGIYRWMYANEPPVLPIEERLPTKE